MTTQDPQSASPDGPAAESTPATLSWPSFLGALAVVLAIFFFLHPIWEARTTDEVDKNIWFSYVPIPLLVLGLLAFERKLNWTSWFLETTKLTLVKFGVTYVVAGVIWSTGNAPVAPETPRTESPVGATDDVFALHDAPQPSALDAATLAELDLRVLRPDGSAAAGVLLHVARGLERLNFPTPDEPYEIRHVNGAFEAGPHLVRAHRELVLRNDSPGLHTAELRDAKNRPLLNRSLPPEGEHRIMFPHGYGVLSLHCRVHPEAEPPVPVIVFAHPFAVLTDDEGRASLRDVPAGELELRARELVFDGEASEVTREVLLEAGTEQSVGFTLP